MIVVLPLHKATSLLPVPFSCDGDEVGPETIDESKNRSKKTCRIRHPSQSLKRCEHSLAFLYSCDAQSLSSQLMDRQLFVHLQAGRKVSGKLRGYDVFLNIVLDDAVEETNAADKQRIGTVVRSVFYS